MHGAGFGCSLCGDEGPAAAVFVKGVASARQMVIAIEISAIRELMRSDRRSFPW
jgi:hypothetical protein